MDDVRINDIQIQWIYTGLEERGINSTTGKTCVKINKKYFRPTEVDTLLGDASKAYQAFGWKPTMTFNEILYDMNNN